LAIGDVRFELVRKVSLNTSESDTGVSRLAKANERRIGEANRLPLGNKKATSKGGFFYWQYGVLGSNSRRK